MKRSVSISFLVVLGTLVVAMPMFAAGNTKTANLAVSATVIQNCTITTTPVAFGNYDPVVANAATPAGDKSATGTVAVACTKGSTGLRIDLDNGVGLPAARRMTGPGVDILNYDLYTDAAHATRWGTGAAAGGGLAIADAPSKAVRSFNVYGLLPGAQDIITGSYNDTVIATINY
jgi:spore coat protein U-like protein